MWQNLSGSKLQALKLMKNWIFNISGPTTLTCIPCVASPCTLCLCMARSCLHLLMSSKSYGFDQPVLQWYYCLLRLIPWLVGAVLPCYCFSASSEWFTFLHVRDLICKLGCLWVKYFKIAKETLTFLSNPEYYYCYYYCCYLLYLFTLFEVKTSLGIHPVPAMRRYVDPWTI